MLLISVWVCCVINRSNLIEICMGGLYIINLLKWWTGILMIRGLIFGVWLWWYTICTEEVGEIGSIIINRNIWISWSIIVGKLLILWNLMWLRSRRRCLMCLVVVWQSVLRLDPMLRDWSLFGTIMRSTRKRRETNWKNSWGRRSRSSLSCGGEERWFTSWWWCRYPS